jgi:hypothetical protein
MPKLQTSPDVKSTQTYISEGTAHADPKRRKSALAAVKHLEEERETLISADVLVELAKSDVKTHDLRAIGGVMAEARDLGLIEPSGLVRRSDKFSRGATTLWKSCIYKQGNPSEIRNWPLGGAALNFVPPATLPYSPDSHQESVSGRLMERQPQSHGHVRCAPCIEVCHHGNT